MLLKTKPPGWPATPAEDGPRREPRRRHCVPAPAPLTGFPSSYATLFAVPDEPRALRLHAQGSTQAAQPEGPARHPDLPRCDALPSGQYRLVAAQGAGGKYVALPGRGDLCRRRAAGQRLSAPDHRPGSRARYRSRGRGGQVELHRVPLPRAGLSLAARAGAQLLQYLFQLAPRANAAPLLAPGQPGAL